MGRETGHGERRASESVVLVSRSVNPSPGPVPVLGAWGEDAPGQPRLEFTEDGRFAGTDGCNRLFGSWDQDGAEVTFGMTGSTMMACEGVDTWLERLHTGRVEGEILHISNVAGDEIGTLTRSGI